MRGRSIHEVSRDFFDAIARADEFDLGLPLRERLQVYRQFLDSNAHRLGPHPGALCEVALAEAEDSVVRQDVLADLAARMPRRPWFRLLRCVPTNRNPALRRVLRGHTLLVFAVALSADGRNALSGSLDKTLRWWGLDSGECLHVLHGHSGEVLAVAAICAWAARPLRQPGRDTAVVGFGQRRVLDPPRTCPRCKNCGVVGGRLRAPLRLWRRGVAVVGPLAFEECLRVLHGHEGWVNAVALSADGRHALSGGQDGTLRWWELASGTCIRVLRGHTGGVLAVALFADGRHALSGGQDGTLRWWDLRQRRVPPDPPRAYPRGECRVVIGGRPPRPLWRPRWDATMVGTGQRSVPLRPRQESRLGGCGGVVRGRSPRPFQRLRREAAVVGFGQRRVLPRIPPGCWLGACCGVVRRQPARPVRRHRQDAALVGSECWGMLPHPPWP